MFLYFTRKHVKQLQEEDNHLKLGIFLSAMVSVTWSPKGKINFIVNFE